MRRASVRMSATVLRTLEERLAWPGAASAALSDTAIVDFVRALCQVSLAEVRSATPRTYSLQRLVEVAAANMDQRIRLVWREIWLPLERHLIVCGCHPLSAVSVYTVDALRQLAARYLERDLDGIDEAHLNYPTGE